MAKQQTQVEQEQAREREQAQAQALVPVQTVPGLSQEERVRLAAVMPRMRDLYEELTARFIERGDVVTALILAALSRQHVMMVGDPGEGKTATTEALAGRIGGEYFYTLLGGQSHVDDILGPLDTKKLMEGMREHDLDGYAATASVVFIDEIAKANESTLNGALLPLLNERKVKNGRARVQTPLEFAVGASNEEFALDADDTMTGHSLRALWDRFTLRVPVPGLSDAGHRQYMADEIARQQMEAMGMDVSGKTGAVTLSLDDLHLLQKAALLVDVPDDVMEAWFLLRDHLRKAGLPVPSTRGSGWMLRVVKAHALVRGQMVTSRADLRALCYVLWDRVSQVSQVRKLVLEVALPLTKEAVELQDQAAEVAERELRTIERADLDTAARIGSVSKGVQEINRITLRVQELRDLATQRGEDPMEMDRILADLALKRKALVMASPINL